MTHLLAETSEIYQGQFGEFTISQADRREVVIYRIALGIAAVCFALGTGLVLWQNSLTFQVTTLLYGIFCLALGVSLATIHIYMSALHRTLQLFWAIGCIAAMIVAVRFDEPLVASIYQHPNTILGIGFTFAALTGIFIKEAFCFNRVETKLLAPLVPLLLLGHWSGLLTLSVEQTLLGTWAILFLLFAARKAIQPIPPDIGDKTVFAYLRSQDASRT
jgi:uncharacterized integral membrane protein